MMSELDKALIEWLDTHRIRAKDVKAWSADSAVGDMTVLSLTVYVNRVDKAVDTPGMVIVPPKGMTPDEAAKFEVEIKAAMSKYGTRYIPGQP